MIVGDKNPGQNQCGKTIVTFNTDQSKWIEPKSNHSSNRTPEADCGREKGEGAITEVKNQCVKTIMGYERARSRALGRALENERNSQMKLEEWKDEKEKWAPTIER